MLELIGHILLLLAKDHCIIYKGKSWYGVILRVLTELNYLSKCATGSESSRGNHQRRIHTAVCVKRVYSNFSQFVYKKKVLQKEGSLKKSQPSPLLVHTSQNSKTVLTFVLVFTKGIAKREALKFHMRLTESVRSPLTSWQEISAISQAEVSSGLQVFSH